MVERALHREKRSSRVTVVVLHFRLWPQVCQTLNSLSRQTRRPDRIVVVDNCSGDGSAQRLRAAYPSVTVLEPPFNGGYAAGMNFGIRHAVQDGADAVLLMTHECLLAPKALEVMVRRVEEQPRVGAVGPLTALLTRRDEVFSAGGYIDNRTYDVSHHGAGARLGDLRGLPPRPVDWLDGCCILLRVTAISEAGRMDEGYFLQYEEVEYLLRLRRLGWIVECAPAAVAWQEPNGAPMRLLVRNRLRFVYRNAPKRLAVREFFRQLYHLTSDLIRGPFNRINASSRLLGIADFALGRRGGVPAVGRKQRAAELIESRENHL